MVVGLLLSACQPAKDETITTGSLLEEMINRDVLAQYPDPFYRTSQFSSYDRNSMQKNHPSWFANWDRSQFVRTDSIEGRREFVVFDAEGPGAVVRFWVTVADYADMGKLRFYFDGATTPEIEGELLSLISGGMLVGAPLSESVSKLTDYKQRGHNLYLPIPYSQSLKITYESEYLIEPGKNSKENFYYNINYRTYEKGTIVQSFSKDDLNRYSKELKRTQEQLLVNTDAKNSDYKSVSTHSKNLAEGANSLQLNGSGAIRNLTVKLHAENFNQALRSTILKIEFDGNETVWVPVGDFFGTGNRLKTYQTYYTKVTNDSSLICYWVMPYRKNCKVTLESVNKEPVMASLSLDYSSWKWNRNSMYFGAGWTEYNRIYTGSKRDMEGTSEQKDINFVTLSGKGVYVGDALTLFNSVADWWGEGDEKIYVDGEEFPSHIGTGTEDYYGYAWCMHHPFEHPFIAQPDGSGDTQTGHVSNVRLRGLDAIPFSQSLVFDMEIWHWASTYINYAPTTFYYILPDGNSNRHTASELAALPVVTQKNQLVSNKPDEKGVIEGEYLDIQLSGGMEKSQTIPWMDWSNQAQMFWVDAAINDKATFRFQSTQKGQCSFRANMTMAPDYGAVKIYLNGKVIMTRFDAYAPTLSSRLVDFGAHEIIEGANELVFEQLPKNKLSSNHFIGLDKLIVCEK